MYSIDRRKIILKKDPKPEVAPHPNYGAFQAISPLSTNENNRSTDLIEALASLTPAAQVMFVEIKRNHKENYGVCSYELPNNCKAKDSSGYKMFSRHTVAITKAKLMRRLPRKIQRELGLEPGKIHFMLNPYMIRCSYFEQAKVIWKSMNK